MKNLSSLLWIYSTICKYEKRLEPYQAGRQLQKPPKKLESSCFTVNMSADLGLLDIHSYQNQGKDTSCLRIAVRDGGGSVISSLFVSIEDHFTTCQEKPFLWVKCAEEWRWSTPWLGVTYARIQFILVLFFRRRKNLKFPSSHWTCGDAYYKSLNCAQLYHLDHRKFLSTFP